MALPFPDTSDHALLSRHDDRKTVILHLFEYCKIHDGIGYFYANRKVPIPKGFRDFLYTITNVLSAKVQFDNLSGMALFVPLNYIRYILTTEYPPIVPRQ